VTWHRRHALLEPEPDPDPCEVSLSFSFSSALVCKGWGSVPVSVPGPVLGVVGVEMVLPIKGIVFLSWAAAEIEGDGVMIVVVVVAVSCCWLPFVLIVNEERRFDGRSKTVLFWIVVSKVRGWKMRGR
jgi:hypothetical protein